MSKLELLTVASRREDWKRISAESFLMSIWRPHRSRDWTEQESSQKQTEREYFLSMRKVPMLCLCWKRCALLESIVRRVVWVQRFAVYKDLLYVVDMACTNLGGSVGSWISVSFQPQRVISGQTWVGSYAMLLWCCRQCGSYEPRILHGSIYLDPKVHILCLDDVACTNPE